MVQGYNIIGDIAGEFKTLEALLKKMPQDAIPLSVGDMIDRGPDSKKVLEFLMKNGQAVLGNHDHFMLCATTKKDYYTNGDMDVWMWNGGQFTFSSFFPDEYLTTSCRDLVDKFPKDIVNWLASLPLYKELEGNPDGSKAFVSHAPKNPVWSLETAIDLDRFANSRTVEDTIIWYRGRTKRMKGFYQIFGHNSHWGFERQTDENGEYGVCIDTSRTRVLTGIHWPSMQVFEQEYIKD